MNESHDFWKEKLKRESQQVPLTELQSLRMLMHEGQTYLGMSKRVRGVPLRAGSDLDFYKERMDYFANHLREKRFPHDSPENLLEVTNQRYRESKRQRAMDNMQWRQEVHLNRQKKNKSEMKDYMQLNPEKDYSPASRYMTVADEYKKFQRNRQILMETNKDAMRQINQNTQLPQILAKNPVNGFSQEHSDLLNKTRLVADRQKELSKVTQQSIFSRANQKVLRPPDEMFSVLQPSLQGTHDEKTYGYKMQQKNRLNKYDSLPSNQFPKNQQEIRRASLNEPHMKTQLNSMRFSSLGFNNQND